MRAATIPYLEELARKNALDAAQNAAYGIEHKRDKLSLLKRQRARLFRTITDMDKEIRSVQSDMRDLKVLELRYKALHLRGETTQLNTNSVGNNTGEHDDEHEQHNSNNT